MPNTARRNASAFGKFFHSKTGGKVYMLPLHARTAVKNAPSARKEPGKNRFSGLFSEL
jgi:hypothetical protein